MTVKAFVFSNKFCSFYSLKNNEKNDKFDLGWFFSSALNFCITSVKLYAVLVC